MTAPPWGHKPPPAMSPRCGYWLTRHHSGTWLANRWLRCEGYHAAAERLGVWIWEYLRVIRPMLDEEE